MCFSSYQEIKFSASKQKKYYPRQLASAAFLKLQILSVHGY